MHTSLKHARWIVLALGGLAASAAQAHPGHGGLLSGFAHPWGGSDHLAAMIAVGIWAITLQGAQRWVLPLAFVTSTLMGALLPASEHAFSFVEQPIAEQGIVLSLLVLGGGLLAALRMPWQVATLLMALAGLCHGYAHSAEIPAEASAATFLTGMVIATTILHGVGMCLGAVTAAHKPQLARFWGVPVTMVGILGLIG